MPPFLCHGNGRILREKTQCLSDIKEALPRYKTRLDEILYLYIEDAISNNGSHCNLYEALGIRKELCLMDSYELDIPRVQRTLRAIESVKHIKGGLVFDTSRGNGVYHLKLGG